MQFPFTRLRRLRTDGWMREMVAEHRVDTSDFIYPMFVCEGKNHKEEIKTMPGVFRMSIDHIVEEAKKAADFGIPMVALFPSVDKSAKSDDAREAFNENNLISRCVRELKDSVPSIGVMGDVALDPYTIHGHDGIIEKNDVDNDLTLEALVKQSLVLARSGIDVIAPSDMMDGRIMMIREAMESNGFHNMKIMSYGVKYVTEFYGPFRDAVGSKRFGYLNKSTYQLDPRSSKQALNEINMDVEEGADMVIIKPGTPYLDVIQRVSQEVRIPVFAYQVSGEYAAIKFAAQNGVLNYDKTMMELFIGFKRAGCSGIITYGALDIAKYIRS
jgi:porphobilinogen synthase